MIKINEEYSFDRDKFGWNLYRFVEARDKKGNPKLKKKTTYHATLEQVCKKIIDLEAGKYDSMKELKAFLLNANESLLQDVQVIIKDHG